MVRHSKSDWDTPFERDHDRGLSLRGIKNANSLRKIFKLYGVFPEKAYISDARRAVETFKILNRRKELLSNFLITPELYDCNASQYLEIIKNLSNDIKSVLFLGHNPELENLANILIGGVNHNLFQKYSTSSFLSITFERDEWKYIAEHPNGKINFFWIPPKPKP